MTRALRVALVNMPFASTRRPSIQLGLLQAIVRQRGIEATTYYLNLRFAARLGWNAYETLCDESRYLVGDWIFSRAAFAEGAPDGDQFLRTFAANVRQLSAALGSDDRFLLDLREREAPAFVEECAASVPWGEYDVVGFGSVFEQNCAALALARLIKERYPWVTIVFGGSNFEGEMGLEYVRTMPWIDYAVIGEGDAVFPALLERLAAGEEVLGMPGVARRIDGRVIYRGPSPMVRDLDALPPPDYDDFFAAAKEVGMPALVRGAQVEVLFESARGCWWGAKHHCTFCGLNGTTMAFRSKSPRRVLSEINELARRHGLYAFMAVDNILDHRYIREVFTPLAEQRKDYNLFYEVKANLTHDQLRTLARAGVRLIQPGIESLSTHVLQLMRKGTTAIQNVRLLKWARYYGITTRWNVLVGFPREQYEDYERQLATMRLIPHLQPPSEPTRIALDRFSPNFVEADERGIRGVRPSPAYTCVYPGHVQADQVAYFFDYEAPDTLPAEAHDELRAYIRWWRQVWKGPRQPFLYYIRGEGRMKVMDGREPGAAVKVHVFDEPAALIYEFCGPTYHSAAAVLAHLRDEHGLDVDEATVQRWLDAFTARRLMLEEDGHYLSLALPANRNW